jgi:hypothetical protein
MEVEVFLPGICEFAVVLLKCLRCLSCLFKWPAKSSVRILRRESEPGFLFFLFELATGLLVLSFKCLNA